MIYLRIEKKVLYDSLLKELTGTLWYNPLPSSIMAKNQYLFVLCCCLTMSCCFMHAQDHISADENCSLDPELALLFSRFNLEEHDPEWPFGEYPKHDVFQ